MTTTLSKTIRTKRLKADMIRAYRSITGACTSGTKGFCQSQKLKEEYTIKEVI